MWLNINYALKAIFQKARANFKVQKVKCLKLYPNAVPFHKMAYSELEIYIFFR